jgi:hypothetical protein
MRQEPLVKVPNPNHLGVASSRVARGKHSLKKRFFLCRFLISRAAVPNLNYTVG